MPKYPTLLMVACTMLTAPLAAEAADTPATSPAATAPATRPAAKFNLIREAPLPEGFPEPAAVGEIVVKKYPAYRLARTAMAEPEEDDAFQTLFQHIQDNDIKMTAPVEMTYTARNEAAAGAAAKNEPNAKPKSMAFLYRKTNMGKPGEAGGKVEVVDVPAMTVVSIAVRGSYSEAQMTDALKKLDAWLADHPDYTRAGPPRMLGYNSPFVPALLRYAEVQVPVTQKPGK